MDFWFCSGVLFSVLCTIFFRRQDLPASTSRIREKENKTIPVLHISDWYLKKLLSKWNGLKEFLKKQSHKIV